MSWAPGVSFSPHHHSNSRRRHAPEHRNQLLKTLPHNHRIEPQPSRHCFLTRPRRRQRETKTCQESLSKLPATFRFSRSPRFTHKEPRQRIGSRHARSARRRGQPTSPRRSDRRSIRCETRRAPRKDPPREATRPARPRRGAVSRPETRFLRETGFLVAVLAAEEFRRPLQHRAPTERSAISRPPAASAACRDANRAGDPRPHTKRKGTTGQRLPQAHRGNSEFHLPICRPGRPAVDCADAGSSSCPALRR
jgi:hypothetical protein